MQGEKRPAAKFFEEDGNHKRGSRLSLRNQRRKLTGKPET
jgi:hypothetical protein